jgi:hypothetical protein
MKTILFHAALLVILGTNVGESQTISSLANTNEGTQVNDVQLSIESSNKVFLVDSTNIIGAQIKNLSTNNIYVVELNPMTDTDLFLTNNKNNIYRLTPDYQRSPSQHVSVFANVNPFNHRLNAGETYDFPIPVVISKYINIGSYQLQAVRYFVIDKNRREKHEFVSNHLAIEVK